MTWWGVGITAALGVKKGMDNEKRMEKQDQFRKASIMYSPWTGMGDPGSQQLPGALESGIQGGLTGAMISTAGAKGGGATEAASSGTTAAAGNGGVTLGAADMGQKMEALKFSPQEMQAPMQGGVYTSMGPQPGSAGALGTGANQQGLNFESTNPMLKYSFMNKYKTP